MNAFRHLMSSGSATRQFLLFVVFSVLVSRALLSGTVMIDPDQTARGMLVICSGHGPIFVQGTPGMDMSSDTPSMGHHGDGHNSTDKMGDICAFSASLVTALALAACLLLLFLPLASRRTWTLPRVAIAARLVTHVRPPPRAPPVFG